MMALGMGLLWMMSSVDHQCIMSVLCIVYYIFVWFCMYIIASSPKRLPFPIPTMENIQVGIWPFWRGKPVFLPFAFLGGYSCHLAFNELLLGVRIIILWVRFDVFFQHGWVGMRHKVTATNHLTFYRKVPGHPGHPRHGPSVYDIMDLMKKRNKKNPPFFNRNIYTLASFFLSRSGLSLFYW